MDKSEPVPQEQLDKLNEALTEIFGLHGAWVIGLEVYNSETGEPWLTTAWDAQSTKWVQLGIARAVEIDIETTFTKVMGGDD